MATVEFYVLEEDTYAPKKEHNMGNYDGSNYLTTKFQIWNNRYGEVDEATIKTPSLYFYYKNVEDNNLLGFYSIKVDGVFTDFVIQGNKGVLNINRNLLGIANDGADTNTKNYVTIEMIFNPNGATLKNNDLKELYLELR